MMGDHHGRAAKSHGRDFRHAQYVLVSRISALGTRPVSPDYLDKHQLNGISLERIRRDRILQEALAAGADPLHLALVFNIDRTNAMAYAHAARNLLSSPADQAPSRRPKSTRARRARRTGKLGARSATYFEHGQDRNLLFGRDSFVNVVPVWV